MSSTKAKKDAKLKARKTSLSKKTNEELIDIILKKDNTERKNNEKIMSLRETINKKDVVINELNDDINQLQEDLITNSFNDNKVPLYKNIAIGISILFVLLAILFIFK